MNNATKLSKKPLRATLIDSNGIRPPCSPSSRFLAIVETDKKIVPYRLDT